MGHQESFLHCADFDYLVEKVQGLGKQWFDERWVNVVEIVTLDKDLKFSLEQMCHPEIKRSYPKGTKFLWITGDRGYQRSLYNNDLNDHGLFGDKYDDKIIERYFIECMSDKLFGENNEWKFTSEPFVFKN